MKQKRTATIATVLTPSERADFENACSVLNVSLSEALRRWGAEGTVRRAERVAARGQS